LERVARGTAGDTLVHQESEALFAVVAGETELIAVLAIGVSAGDSQAGGSVGG